MPGPHAMMLLMERKKAQRNRKKEKEKEEMKKIVSKEDIINEFKNGTLEELNNANVEGHWV